MTTIDDLFTKTPGRETDPATVQNVPVHTEILWNTPNEVDVKIAAWNRETDKVREFCFRVTGEQLGTIVERPLDVEDTLWLRNIGAR